MELAGLNLNHLLSLDALLRHRNVRKAAEEMSVTQSAMSHTLRALREQFDDQLLVRVGNEMVLTPYAAGIEEQLRAGISTLQGVVNGRAGFDPSQVKDEFTLAIHDGTATALAPHLTQALQERAPQASLYIAPVEVHLAVQLQKGEVDVALIPPMLDTAGMRFEEQVHMTVGSVLVCRADHPRVGDEISLDEYCAEPHLVISLGGKKGGFIDEMLAKQGRSRHIQMRLPYLSAVPGVLEASDMLILVPEPAAVHLSRQAKLKTVALPFTLPPMSMLLCWHDRFAADPAHRFFMEVTRTAIARLVEVESA